nr:hypothetical protein [Anaerolineales bacterium]
MTEANRKVTVFHNIAIGLLILILAGYWIYINTGDPLAFYTIRYDPEYPYFLNSLSIVKGRPYAYIDHPGTPVQLLGSTILLLTFPFLKATGTPFVMYHLTHPETFLRLARGFLMIVSIATLYLITRNTIRVRNWKDALASLGIAASFYAIHPPFSFETLAYWSQNSFAFPFGTLLLLLLFIRLRTDRRLLWWELFLFGAGTGLLTAIQLWFAAWVIGVAVAVLTFDLFQSRNVLRGLLSGSVVCFGALTGFIFSTLPILHEYPRFFGWVNRLLTHQGKYGFGERGFSSLSLFFENFSSLWNETPLIFVALASVLLLLASLAWQHHQKLRENMGLWSFALGMTIQVLFSLVMISKHPGNNYLLALTAVLPLLFGIAYLLSSQISTRIYRAMVTVSALLLVGFFFSLTQSIAYHRELLANVHIVDDEVAQLREQLSRISVKEPAEVNVLWSYGTGTKCFALRYGDIYTHGVFLETLKQLCPHDGLHDIFSDSHDISRIQRWDILIVPENKLSREIKDIGEVRPSNAQTMFGRVHYVMVAEGAQ